MTQEVFLNIADQFLQSSKPGEVITLNLSAENSQFIRFTKGYARQTTHIDQTSYFLQIFTAGRAVSRSLTGTGVVDVDVARLNSGLEQMREMTLQMPPTPFDLPPNGTAVSALNKDRGAMPDLKMVQDDIDAIDLAGLLTFGPLQRGYANSLGGRQWFDSSLFVFDFSLYFGDRAVKQTYSGSNWDQDQFRAKIKEATKQLELMKQPKKKLEPGSYRVFLSSRAVSDLVSHWNWMGLATHNIADKSSHLLALANGQVQLSPHFSLQENYGLGFAEAFDSTGQPLQNLIPLIQDGRFVQGFCSLRTQTQYKEFKANGAHESESMRCTEIAPGTLANDQILSHLKTGVFISDVHYLSWSDPKTARATGMTRFSCFWVEEGTIVAPIEDMRFDVSYYDLFGEKTLLGLTRETDSYLDNSTYESRSLGGIKVPGALVDGFKFTL